MAANINELMLQVVSDIKANQERMMSQQTRSRRQAMSSIGGGIVGGLSVAGIVRFIRKTVEMEAAIGKLSRQFGASSAQVLGMERASARFGTSMSKTLTGLQQIFSAVGTGDISSFAEPLARAGMKLKPLIDLASGGNVNPVKIFTEIQRQWSQMSGKQRVIAAQTLGFDQGTMNILNNPALYQEQLKKLTLSPEETAKRIKESEEAKRAFDNLGVTLENLSRNIVHDALPAFQQVSSLIEEMAKNYAVVKEGMKVAEDTLNKAYKEVSGEKLTQPELMAEKYPVLSAYEEERDKLKSTAAELAENRKEYNKLIKEGKGSEAGEFMRDVMTPNMHRYLQQYSAVKYFSSESIAEMNKGGESRGNIANFIKLGSGSLDELSQYNEGYDQLADSELKPAYGGAIAPTLSYGDINITLSSTDAKGVMNEFEEQIEAVLSRSLKKAVHNAKGGQ